MAIFKVYSPDLGERKDAESIEAVSYEDAAENFAEFQDMQGFIEQYKILRVCVRSLVDKAEWYDYSVEKKKVVRWYADKA
jgi:hypothetical protein